MDCPLNYTFIYFQNSGLAHPRQYSKRQTRGVEIEKCLDENLEPTYHFSNFNRITQFLIYISYNCLSKFKVFE